MKEGLQPIVTEVTDAHSQRERSRELISYLATEGTSAPEIIEQAALFAAGSENETNLTERILFDTAENMLHDPVANSEVALQIIAPIRPTIGLADSLADMGKYLSRNDELRTRGQQVLQRSSEVFEQAWDTNEEVRSEEVLLDSYARVATLQEEAGDGAGARQTAIAVGERLLDFEATHPALDDGSDRIFRDMEVEFILNRINDIYDDLHKRLYESVTTESVRKDIDRDICINQAMKYVQQGDLELAFEHAKRLDSVSGFGMMFYHFVYTKLMQPDTGAGRDLFEAYENAFPEVFEQNNNIELGFTQLGSVLVVLEKYDLLAKLIISTIEEDDVADYSVTKPHVQRATMAIASLYDRERVERFRKLLPENFHAAVDEAHYWYAIGQAYPVTEQA